MPRTPPSEEAASQKKRKSAAPWQRTSSEHSKRSGSCRRLIRRAAAEARGPRARPEGPEGGKANWDRDPSTVQPPTTRPSTALSDWNSVIVRSELSQCEKSNERNRMRRRRKRIWRMQKAKRLQWPLKQRCWALRCHRSSARKWDRSSIGWAQWSLPRKANSAKRIIDVRKHFPFVPFRRRWGRVRCRSVRIVFGKVVLWRRRPRVPPLQPKWAETSNWNCWRSFSSASRTVKWMVLSSKFTESSFPKWTEKRCTQGRNVKERVVPEQRSDRSCATTNTERQIALS